MAIYCICVYIVFVSILLVWMYKTCVICKVTLIYGKGLYKYNLFLKHLIHQIVVT